MCSRAQPDRLQARYALGLVRYAQGDVAGAIDAYRRVLAADPAQPDARYNLALVLKLARREAEATPEFVAAAQAGHAARAVLRRHRLRRRARRRASSWRRRSRWWFRAAEQGVPQADDALAQLRQVAVGRGRGTRRRAAGRRAGVRRVPRRALDGVPRARPERGRHGRRARSCARAAPARPWPCSSARPRPSASRPRAAGDALRAGDGRRAGARCAHPGLHEGRGRRGAAPAAALSRRVSRALLALMIAAAATLAAAAARHPRGIRRRHAGAERARRAGAAAGSREPRPRHRGARRRKRGAPGRRRLGPRCARARGGQRGSSRGRGDRPRYAARPRERARARRRRERRAARSRRRRGGQRRVRPCRPTRAAARRAGAGRRSHARGGRRRRSACVACRSLSGRDGARGLRARRDAGRGGRRRARRGGSSPASRPRPTALRLCAGRPTCTSCRSASCGRRSTGRRRASATAGRGQDRAVHDRPGAGRARDADRPALESRRAGRAAERGADRRLAALGAAGLGLCPPPRCSPRWRPGSGSRDEPRRRSWVSRCWRGARRGRPDADAVAGRSRPAGRGAAGGRAGGRLRARWCGARSSPLADCAGWRARSAHPRRAGASGVDGRGARGGSGSGARRRRAVHRRRARPPAGGRGAARSARRGARPGRADARPSAGARARAARGGARAGRARGRRAGAAAAPVRRGRHRHPRSCVLALFQDLEKAARASLPILIAGEPGTGKELFARAAHRLSARADRALRGGQHGGHRPPSCSRASCSATCAAASPGAVADRKGYFEQAHGGTIFLDEIGELRAEHQGKLLRVLQEQELLPGRGDPPDHRRRAGGRREQPGPRARRAPRAGSARTSISGCKASSCACRRCGSGRDDVPLAGRTSSSRDAAAEVGRRRGPLSEDALRRARAARLARQRARAAELPAPGRRAGRGARS